MADAKQVSAAGSAVVERNISALLARRRSEEEELGFQERLAGAITKFVGTISFVCIHVLALGAWIAINLGWVGLPRFDPTLGFFATFVSVEAIVLTTFVLIGQNRMAQIEARQADLSLQITLLAEHEITRLIHLVRAIAAQMNIAESQDPEIVELAQDLPAEHVLDTLKRKANE